MLLPVEHANQQDQQHMRHALELAHGTIGLASPNPQVGCVLIRPSSGPGEPDRLLGEGAHRYDQRDHAEIVALHQAADLGHDVRGATAYVTLEPCAHHGRTGPCAEALVAAGIARCVVATQDPNPLVGGQGLAILRRAGIAVTLGVLEQEAQEVNLAFAWSIQHGRPLVTLKAALSVDGYLAPPTASRATTAAPFWLTGPAARADVHQLRHANDAILTGIGTVLADDPELTDRSGLPRRRPLLRVVLDPGLRTPPGSRLLRSGRVANAGNPPDLLLLGATSASPEREAALRDAAAPGSLEILRLPAGPAGRFSLPAVLALLAERQCRGVLLEAGSALNSAFLHEDLVGRVVLYFAPAELGAGSLPFAAGGPSPFLLQERLRHTTHREFGPDVRVSGLLHSPWPDRPAEPSAAADRLP